MSVATEFAPEVFIPPQARAGARPVHRRTTEVVVALRPSYGSLVAATDFEAATLYGTERAPARLLATAPRAASASLRLSRRGIAVLAIATAALGAALLLTAWRSAPARTPGRPVPAVVSVQAGDTLWSIAARAAPDRDTRDEVSDLLRLNNLSGAQLQPGQVLRTR